MSDILVERVLHGSGVVIVGSNFADAPDYVDYLTANSIGVLSYANMIDIMGAFFVFCLLLKMFGVFKGLRKLYQLMRR